jgi:hypothetical protein
MELHYHRLMTEEALGAFFSAPALQEVVAGNFSQDSLWNLVGKDHLHYDGSAFAAGDAYLAEEREKVFASLKAASPAPARAALGRLLHTAQDFYAHSNYVTLWREQFPSAPPTQIEPLLPALLHSPRLVSGRVYWGEVFAFIPALKPLTRRLLPRDSHAWMNKDDPTRPDFDYALAAASARTRAEWEQIRLRLSETERNLLTDAEF